MVKHLIKGWLKIKMENFTMAAFFAVVTAGVGHW